MEPQAIKEQLAKLGQKLSQENIIFPVAGNLSARCGENFIVKATGESIDKFEDFILIDVNGNPLEEGKPSGMAPVHCEILKAREDVNVVLHWRGIYSDALAAFMDRFPMTPEMMFVIQSEVPVVTLTKIKSIKELASWQTQNAREKLIRQKDNSFITPFLGTWTVARDTEQMYWRVKVLEMTAESVVHKKLLEACNIKINPEAPQWLINAVHDYLSTKEK